MSVLLSVDLSIDVSTHMSMCMSMHMPTRISITCLCTYYLRPNPHARQLLYVSTIFRFFITSNLSGY